MGTHQSLPAFGIDCNNGYRGNRGAESLFPACHAHPLPAGERQDRPAERPLSDRSGGLAAGIRESRHKTGYGGTKTRSFPFSCLRIPGIIVQAPALSPPSTSGTQPSCSLQTNRPVCRLFRTDRHAEWYCPRKGNTLHASGRDKAEN